MTFISKDDCPKGENCPVHYRVTEHDTGGFISLIDYIGPYAIHTQETDELEAIQMLLGLSEKCSFRVKVYCVGEGGTLAELAEDIQMLEIMTLRDIPHRVPDHIGVDGGFSEYLKGVHNDVCMDLAVGVLP